MDRTEAAVIFRTYAKKLYNTALRITASVPDAEGIMQETMIRYLTRAPRLDCEQKKYAWLRSTPAYAVGQTGNVFDLFGLYPFCFFRDRSTAMSNALCHWTHFFNFF